MREIEIILRTHLFPAWIIYSLVISLIIISLLKFKNENVFTDIRLSFFSPINSVHFAKDELRYFSLTNILLLINYFIVSSTIVYMGAIYFEINSWWIYLSPIIYYFFIVFSLGFISILSGEVKKIQPLVTLTNLISIIIGIILIPFIIIWLLNPQYSLIIIKSVFVIFTLLHLILILRKIFVSVNNKILWYYIILYLCTFEIGGLLIVYTLASPYFIGS